MVALMPRDHGKHCLGLRGRMARGAARAIGAGGRPGTAGTLGEADDPCGTVLGVQAVQHGEPVLDQPAHGAAPRVLGDPARLALHQEDRLGEGGLQSHGLVEDAPVSDRRRQVIRALALDRQPGPEHVVTHRQVGQPYIEAGRDKSIRDRATALPVIDQHRTQLDHTETLPARRCGPMLQTERRAPTRLISPLGVRSSSSTWGTGRRTD
jgi:hypothetical protein